MDPKKRLIALVKEAVRQIGSGQRLADYLGVTPAAVTNWKSGRDAPKAHYLIRMQDLVKKAACVLIALGTLMGPEPVGATGVASARGQDIETNYSLHIVRQFIAWTLSLFQAAGLPVRPPTRYTRAGPLLTRP